MKRRYYRRRKGISKKEQPFFNERTPAVQTKEEKQPFFQNKEEGLKVGKPGDKYELEADAMADAVMSNSAQATAIQRKEISGIQRTAEEEEGLQAKIQRQEIEEEPDVQQQAEEEEVQMQAEEEELQKKSDEEEVQMKEEEDEIQAKEDEEDVQMKEDEEEVQKQEEEEVQQKEEEELQTKTQSKANPSRAGAQLSHRIQQSSGSGNPLPPKTRQKMEAAFGVDFGDVSIHTNSKAAEMNKELHAQAFTHGKDIYFNRGKYQPETNTGQHLLAHELSHVVQQGKKECETNINRTHFSRNYTSWAVTPHQVTEGDPRSYSVDFYIRAALEVNLVTGLDSEAIKGMIEQSLNRHGGGWKSITNTLGETTRVYVRFHISWQSFSGISTEVLAGNALGISVLPDDTFADIEADGMFVHDGATNRILLKGGPAMSALLRGRRNRARRQRGENRFGNEVTHEMGHALGLEHRARTVMNRSNTESTARRFDGNQIKQMMINTTRDSALLPSWITGQVRTRETP